MKFPLPLPYSPPHFLYAQFVSSVDIQNFWGGLHYFAFFTLVYLMFKLFASSSFLHGLNDFHRTVERSLPTLGISSGTCASIQARSPSAAGTATRPSLTQPPAKLMKKHTGKLAPCYQKYFSSSVAFQFCACMLKMDGKKKVNDDGWYCLNAC